MKIFHLIPSWSLGGAERVIEVLVDGYSRDIQVNVLTFKQVDRDDSFHSLVFLKSGRIRKYISFLCYIFKHKPDVVHAHMLPSIPFLILLRIFKWRLKIVYTVHGEYRKRVSKVLIFMDYLFYTMCRINIVCVSESTYQSISKFWKLPKFVIYNGITPITLAPARAINDEIGGYKKTPVTKVFMAITRIVPVKNLELMVAAFKQLDRVDDVVLLIVGYDPTRDQKEINKLKGIGAGNVFFLGQRLNGSEYLAYADAFCMSSKSEALPIAVLESIAVGVPVLSTAVGGIPEVIIPGFNGFLSLDQTEASYVKMLKDFISLRGEAIQILKTNARRSFEERFSSTKMCQEYFKIYCNGL